MNSVYAKPCFAFWVKRVILIVGFHTISPEDLEFVDSLIDSSKREILFSDVFEQPQGRMRVENRKGASVPGRDDGNRTFERIFSTIGVNPYWVHVEGRRRRCRAL